jgi:hypothetical protein
MYYGSTNCTLTVRPQNGGDAATVQTAPRNMGIARAFLKLLEFEQKAESGPNLRFQRKRNGGCEATAGAEEERCGDGDGMAGRSSTEVLDGDLRSEQEKSCCNSSLPDPRREREGERK